MNLDNFDTIINSTIMKRGENYYNKNFVEDLTEVVNGIWRSSIEGSDLYEVEVSLDKQNVRYWSCTCPYNGDICKHVAATLLSIREGYKNDTHNKIKAITKIDKTVSKTTKVPTKLTQLDNVLKKASHKEIVDFVRDLIKDDRKLLDKTLLNFQTYTGHKQSATLRCRSQFNAIIKLHSSRGYIDYRASTGFGRDTSTMIETFLSSQITALESIECCFEVLKIMMKKVVNVIDDSNGELANICYHLADVLTNRFSSLTKEQETKCFDKLLFWEFESELKDYGLDQYFDELTPALAIDNEKFQNRYLKTIDKALLNTSDNWQVESLNQKKLAQLSNWGRVAEAEKLSSEKIEIPEFRKIFINKAINEKDFETARSLTNEGIKLAKKKQHPGTVSDWREVLLDIAIKTKDVDAIRTELLNVLESSWIDMKRYRQLKATYETEEWQQVQAEHTKRILKKNNVPYAWAEIYAEEKQLRKLFDLIQSDENEASSLFKKHLKILADEFPEESANFYAIIIHHELKQTDKKVYQQAVKDIKALKKLPMGEAIAEQLIKEVTLKYNNRPSMIDIFKRAFGEIN